MTSLDTVVKNVMDKELSQIEEALNTYKSQLEADVHKQKKALDEAAQAEEMRMKEAAQARHQIAMHNLGLKGRDERLHAQQDMFTDYLKAVQLAMQDVPSETVAGFIAHVCQNLDSAEDSELVLGDLTQAQLGAGYQAPLPVAADVLPGVAGFVIREGSIEYDYTFASLVADARRELQGVFMEAMRKEEA